MDTPTASSYGSDDGRVPAEAPGRGRDIASGRRGESDEGAVPRELAAPPVYPRAPPPAAHGVARNFTAHADERGEGSSSSRVPPTWPDTVVVAGVWASINCNFETAVCRPSKWHQVGRHSAGN